MNKRNIMEKLSIDFGYSEKELKTFEWIKIEKCEDWNNIFFNGDYVLFANDKIVWY